MATCIGGSNHGQGFSGQPYNEPSIEVFRLDSSGERIRPLAFERYHKDHDPRFGPFWRFEGLDTAEKREAAILARLAEPVKPGRWNA